MASREEMSLSFGAAAGAYESGRPDYPREAVDWMLAPVRAHDRALRVADVGAGTGKLTRTIVEAGAEVVAIDPDPGMLAALREHVHGVPTFVGTGERMPLPDASLDAVLLGQAWHWVDPVAASAEAARVLRAGGVLGLVWNIRDESDPWVARRPSDPLGPRVRCPRCCQRRRGPGGRVHHSDQRDGGLTHVDAASRQAPQAAPPQASGCCEGWHLARVR